MNLYDGCKEILKIQKFRRIVSYAGFYCFVTVLSYAYNSNTTRAGFSRDDQFYASYPAGTELLTDSAKICGTKRNGNFSSHFFSLHKFLHKSMIFLFVTSYIKLHLAIALKRKNGDLFNGASWLNTSNAKENHHMHIMHNTWRTLPLLGKLMEVASGSIRYNSPARSLTRICRESWQLEVINA
ncbi:hypothetical protein TEA_019878 [Camellia sinensis var. sinensis]|uniref:Uncharacterized protein n=1 Tax=Camellia sinensis var. sinensis TaxID=542762 RepID=A0A4S4DDL0_CAMSN|nr:hypothetical protein TEA_019878 [Camellia sinensis var. sinensis]